jgi:hypothetical protein
MALIGARPAVTLGMDLIARMMPQDQMELREKLAGRPAPPPALRPAQTPMDSRI